MSECIDLVRAKVIKSNGASMTNSLKSEDGVLYCMAHFGQTIVDGSDEFVSCFKKPTAENAYYF